MSKKTIKLKDYQKVVEEYVAAGKITPGMLVELTNDNTVKAQSKAGGVIMIANEDEFQGKTINDDYVKDDLVQVWIPQRGDMAYAVLAASQTIVVGDLLISNKAGAFEKLAAQEAVGAILAQAAEAVTTTTAVGRIIVRIL